MIKGILSCGCIIYDEPKFTPCNKHKNFDLEKYFRGELDKDENDELLKFMCKDFIERLERIFNGQHNYYRIES